MATRLTWLTRAAWFARAHADGTIPEAVGLRKVFIADAVDKQSAPDGTTLYRFTLSTGAVDRDRDTIAPAGWRLDHYRQNPVVMWAHDYLAPPLGQCVELTTEHDRLMGAVRFDGDLSPFAAMIEAMVARGTLRATSVGFQPLKTAFVEERRGVDFLEQELLEWSIVPVPANPEALAEAKAAGIDLAPYREWLERGFVALEGSGFWVSRRTLEATWAAVGPVTRLAGPPKAKTVPPDVSRATADQGESWSAPTLSDFTEDSWGDLSETAKRRIAGHYAWARTLPPETFGDLKLPHHRAGDGQVVWRGVVAAMAVLMGGRGGVDVGDDREAVYRHLASHYRQFDAEPPELRASPDALVATVRDAVIKRGRVLSAANEAELRAAAGSAADCMDRVLAVLAKLESAPEDDGKGLRFTIESDAESDLPIERDPDIDVTAEDLRPVVREAVEDLLRAHRLATTGRLD